MIIPRAIIARACYYVIEPEASYMDYPINQPSQPTSPRPAATTPENLGKETPSRPTDHPVLSRLMEEVRNERGVEARYDRVHNRHNRGR